MLEGWNDRTDLHLSLQPTLTTPIAYRNDQWCRGVWGSQQVHSAFLQLFHSVLPLPPLPLLLSSPFLLHDTEHGGMDPTDRLPQPPCAPRTSQLTREPLPSTTSVTQGTQGLHSPHSSLLL